MIVRDLNPLSSSFAPDEAYSPLIVDTNRVLSRPITFESFQAIPRRYAKVIQVGCVVQYHQFLLRLALDSTRPPCDSLALEYRLRVSVAKVLYHYATA